MTFWRFGTIFQGFFRIYSKLKFSIDLFHEHFGTYFVTFTKSMTLESLINHGSGIFISLLNFKSLTPEKILFLTISLTLWYLHEMMWGSNWLSTYHTQPDQEHDEAYTFDHNQQRYLLMQQNEWTYEPMSTISLHCNDSLLWDDILITISCMRYKWAYYYGRLAWLPHETINPRRSNKTLVMTKLWMHMLRSSLNLFRNLLMTFLKTTLFC